MHLGASSRIGRVIMGGSSIVRGCILHREDLFDRSFFLPPSVLNWIVAWKMNRLSLSIFSFSFFSLLPPFSPFTHGFRYFVVRISRTSVASEEGRSRAERLSMKRRERDGKGDTRSAIKPRSFARIISSRAPPVRGNRLVEPSLDRDYSSSRLSLRL